MRGGADLRFACLRSVSIVGTRAATAYGTHVTVKLAAALELDPVSLSVLEAVPARVGRGPARIAVSAGVDFDTVLRCLGELAAGGFGSERCDEAGGPGCPADPGGTDSGSRPDREERFRGRLLAKICPIPARLLPFQLMIKHAGSVALAHRPFEDLVAHLTQSSSLGSGRRRG